MKLIERWLFPSRTIGCSATKKSSVNDELLLLGPIDRREYDRAMELVLGKEWKKVPVREMMGLLNMRFDCKPIDYSEKEVAPILHLMNSHAKDLSIDQVKFLRENDHLPRSNRKNGGVWMDKDELLAYAREKEEDIHKKRMNYFITMNGVVSAYVQSIGNAIAQNTERTRKPFQFSHIHMIIVAIIILGAVIFIVI